MAIFRDLNQSKSDRSAEDVRRHRELISDSIKKNLQDIVIKEDIIGQSGKKKVSIPIRGIKEYQFVYGKNKSGVGSGTGDEKRGDKVGEDQSQQPGKGKGSGEAGNEEGEDIYQIEVDIDEVINYLFEDFQLPDIDKKKLADSEDMSYKRLGYQKKGINPRLAKKRSVIEKIKREKAAVKAQREYNIENGIEFDEQELSNTRFPFSEDDLRYHRIKQKPEPIFNAVIFCIMDTSGSMDDTKKYLAKSFYLFLYKFIKLKYEKVDLVFVSHSTTAKEVVQNEFFSKVGDGGTYISSGYFKALEIIENRYNPNHWNIYAFHASDGDNWAEDNQKTIEAANKLCDVCNLFGYGEIKPYEHKFVLPDSTIKKELLKGVVRDNFVAVDIKTKDDILPSLKKLLDKDR